MSGRERCVDALKLNHINQSRDGNKNDSKDKYTLINIKKESSTRKKKNNTTSDTTFLAGTGS